MEKIVNGFVIEKDKGCVTIIEETSTPLRTIISLRCDNGRELQLVVDDMLRGRRLIITDFEALQAAIEMLAETQKPEDKKFVCRECLDHPNTKSFILMDPAQTHCQKTGTDFNDLPDQKCPLDKPERLRDEYLDRLEDGG